MKAKPPGRRPPPRCAPAAHSRHIIQTMKTARACDDSPYIHKRGDRAMDITRHMLVTLWTTVRVTLIIWYPVITSSHYFFFFFDFTYIPEHVTKTKAGRPWPIHESGDFLNYGCSSHACGAVTPLIRSQVPYERRQAGLQLVDVAPGQRGQGQKVHHVILSSQYHPSEWGSR